MTVYVDDLRTWNGKTWCSLCGTNASELDAFAMLKLGLRPGWVQNVGGFRHYDLRPKLREVALRKGARYISTEDLMRRVRKREE